MSTKEEIGHVGIGDQGLSDQRTGDIEDDDFSFPVVCWDAKETGPVCICVTEEVNAAGDPATGLTTRTVGEGIGPGDLCVTATFVAAFENQRVPMLATIFSGVSEQIADGLIERGARDVDEFLASDEGKNWLDEHFMRAPDRTVSVPKEWIRMVAKGRAVLR